MTMYNGLQSVCVATLGAYALAGFSLTEAGADVLLLSYRGNPLKCYRKTTVTVVEVRDFCRTFHRGGAW
jgi:hypothetical protein